MGSGLKQATDLLPVGDQLRQWLRVKAAMQQRYRFRLQLKPSAELPIGNLGIGLQRLFVEQLQGRWQTT